MVAPRIGSSIDVFSYVSVSLEIKVLDSHASVACQKKRTGLPCLCFMLKETDWTHMFLFHLKRKIGLPFFWLMLEEKK
jgi:hypothetical protein